MWRLMGKTKPGSGGAVFEELEIFRGVEERKVEVARGKVNDVVRSAGIRSSFGTAQSRWNLLFFFCDVADVCLPTPGKSPGAADNRSQQTASELALTEIAAGDSCEGLA